MPGRARGGAALDGGDPKDRAPSAKHHPTSRQTEESQPQNSRSNNTMERSKIEPSIQVATVHSIKRLKADEDQYRSAYDKGELPEWTRHECCTGDLSLVLGRTLG